ncbi:hypothetical protein N0V88_003247 [Collariella sp. IMI 366227]|nr:hypothetical protein N0V88_003247 [Collariella sp. IMI 366227]
MATAQIPAGGTYLDTFKASFVNVPIDAENANAVSTTEFLDAAESLTTFFDLLGSVAFSPVKKDMMGNIEKLRKRQLEAPLESQNLQDLVRNELKTKSHKATEGLLWLVRGLEFTCIALSQNVASGTDELADSFRGAYGVTLKPHHSFLVKPIFSAAMSACPYRKDFYAKLGEDDEKNKEALREYLAALDKVVAILKAFLDSKDAKITLFSALASEGNILLKLSHPLERLDFFGHLYLHAADIETIVAHHLRVPKASCKKLWVDEWLHGSSNVCIPVYADGMKWVVIRFPLPFKRTTLFRDLSRIMLSLAHSRFPKIGSLRIDNAIISLTNRPLMLQLHQLENDGILTNIPRNQTYRAMDSNIFIDENWHITALIDLEWTCALPVEMLHPPFWLTGQAIDRIKDDDTHEHGFTSTTPSDTPTHDTVRPPLSIRMASQRKAGVPKKPTAKSRAKKPDGKSVKSKAQQALSVPILQLPPEIVLLVDELLGLDDRLALSRANRWFHSVINPVIYRDNVKLGSASSLFWGAENGQLATLKHALAAGADLNARGPPPKKPGESDPTDGDDNTDVDGNGDDPGVELFEEPPDPNVQVFGTPLHLAAKHGHRDIVDWLLDNGADINAPSHRICECQSLKSGRQPGQRLREYPRWRALHTAMCHQERAVAELLIHRGASLDLDESESHNHTALHSAAAHGLIPVIKLLALNDVQLDVNQRDNWGNTALHYVSEIWSPRDSPDIRDTITKLLALGADLEAHNQTGHTPLLNACFRGNFAVAHRLVNIGGNPDPHRHIRGFRDCRPLYYCMLPRNEFFDMEEAPVKHDEFEGNRVTLIKALADAGADVNARFDKRGYRSVTPLMLACEMAEPRAVAALAQCGAEINAQDRNARTPLCYAVTIRVDHRGEVPEIAEILLRRGARMDLEEEPNGSPLDTAIKHIRWAEDDVLEAMLSVADEKNLTRGKLKEALRSCASSGNHKALKLLLNFAARVYEVTDADVKDYLCRIIEQSDPWNQIETFNCMMDFGRLVYTNEMLLLKTIMQQNRELTLAVLERGVAVSDQRFHGDQTYLHLACQWGDLEVVKALLDRGADADVFDRELRTPLSIAVSENFVCIAVALMKEVADPFLLPPDILLQSLFPPDDEPDEWRFIKRRYLTPFDLAIRDDRVDILDDMLSRYALPDIPPKSRTSYVHRAAQNPNPAILKLLLDKGADPRGGEQSPNEPAITLLRRVWDSPRLLENAVSLLQTAKVLLDKYGAGDFPWDLIREIALDRDGDERRREVREVVVRELRITVGRVDEDGEVLVGQGTSAGYN